MQSKYIQRRRIRGWKMPNNTKYVGRGTQWGNPFKVVNTPDHLWKVSLVEGVKILEGYLLSHTKPIYHSKIEAQQAAVDCYQALMESTEEQRMAKALLKGFNLSCWCKPDEPCHAKVLLDIINSI